MVKNLFFWMVAALVIFLFWSVSSRIQRDERLLDFSDFLSEVEAGHVDRVIIQGESIVGDFTNGRAFRTVAPPQAGENLIDILRTHGVDIEARDPSSDSWLGHIISWTPIVIMIAFLMFFMRQLQGGRRTAVWNDQQRRELKLSILYRLAEGDKAASEEDLVSALIEPGRPTADAVRGEVRRALYEMLSDGTVALTADKKFRAQHIAAND